ncbi:aldehyde dehydrogenase family protein [Corynebacterium sp. 4HC-13]|uniref:succinic semialdehyde dehydrogenase n=1 Tax=Corynebacterium anserum TaxID=2684406 RepID=UPI00163AD174|nr:succinic semialdehyde dehydrogenase [Corynebacterium anserum]MBC2681978.1 aldehyde dehydrogenase family protein [Corynebacterium anserum]
MTPQRLKIGPLPAEFAAELRGLSANARIDRIDENADDNLIIEAPWTGETIGWVASGNEETVNEAFRRARRAQKSWRHVPVAERKKIFCRFHDSVLKNRELLADMVQLETGKSRNGAFDEVLDVANNTRYYINRVEKLMKPKKRRSAVPVLAKSYEYRQPLGVTGQIAPWNYPLTLGISDAIPSLLAGNGIVAKPDSSTPFTSLLVFKLLYEAGLPRDLVQLVTGSGRVVGTAISEQCDYLMFTGSTKTGKILGETMGRRLVGYSAELGGKNPLIIANDTDMDKTVRGAVEACFSNSGQLCVSIERIYVEQQSYEEFARRFAERTKAMTLGPGFDYETEMGSLASANQLKTVDEFVEDARDKGARIIAGGKARPDLGPYFYEPTVLTDVPDDARLLTEEVFGPVVYIQPVSDLQEAIRLANDTPYGLNSSVWAKPETAWKVGPQIDSGSVALNDGYVAPWSAIENASGGMKESGMAARHGDTGLLKYTAGKNVTEQRFMSMRGPESLSRKNYARIMSSAMRLGKLFKILP